jgi:hypothetical protein
MATRSEPAKRAGGSGNAGSVRHPAVGAEARLCSLHMHGHGTGAHLGRCAIGDEELPRPAASVAAASC